MNTTLHRETLQRSSTADLSRQIDDVLDARHPLVVGELHEHPLDLKEPRPLARVRALFRNLGTKN